MENTQYHNIASYANTIENTQYHNIASYANTMENTQYHNIASYANTIENSQYHNIASVPKSNRKIVLTDNIDIPRTHIHDHSPCCFGTNSSIKK